MKSNQSCEICGDSPRILVDARIKVRFPWPKGHFLYLCVDCYKLYGLDNDVDFFERFGEKFYKFERGIKWLSKVS